jgi:hypothetical protein
LAQEGEGMKLKVTELINYRAIAVSVHKRLAGLLDKDITDGQIGNNRIVAECSRDAEQIGMWLDGILKAIELNVSSS